MSRISFKKYLSSKKLPLNRLLRDLHHNDKNSKGDIEKLDTIDYFIYYIKSNPIYKFNFFKIKTSIIYKEINEIDQYKELNDQNEQNGIINKEKIKSITYNVVKEVNTDAVILSCKELVVFYISPEKYEEFTLSFMFSENYTFEIYKSPRYYIAFCASHTSKNIYPKF